MNAVRSIAVAIALMTGLLLATPLQAQTATLKVSARVIAECTVASRRELVEQARRLNDPSLVRRCSKGVVSRVDRKVVKATKLRTRTTQSKRVSKKRRVRRTVAGQTDVVLFTVTY